MIPGDAIILRYTFGGIFQAFFFDFFLYRTIAVGIMIFVSKNNQVTAFRIKLTSVEKTILNLRALDIYLCAAVALINWSVGRSVGVTILGNEKTKKKTRKKKAAPKRNAISKGWRLFNIIDYYCIFFFFFKCCDRLYIFEIKDSMEKPVENEMSYTRWCCGRVFFFFNWISLCLNRYIISAIFFVIRCALVTRKDFFLTVGRRIEWAAVFFFLGWYMHIRMESAATGIIFDCVKHERLCVTMAGFFSTRDLS